LIFHFSDIIGTWRRWTTATSIEPSTSKM